MTEPHLAMGLRLRAARLLAGHVSVTDAIGLLDVPGAAYRAAEYGRRRPSSAILLAVRKLFGASDDFVFDGSTKTEAERRIADLAAVLGRAVAEGWTGGREVADRLRRLRRAAGFRSAAAFAEAHGLKATTCLNHEGGSKEIPLDRAVAYAFALGVDPRLMLFGDGDVEEPEASAAEEVVPAKVLDRRDVEDGLGRIADGVVDVEEAAQIVAACLAMLDGDLAAGLYGALRSWTWIAVDARRRDDGLTAWLDVMGRVASHIEADHAALAAKLETCAELLHTSIGVVVEPRRVGSGRRGRP